MTRCLLVSLTSALLLACLVSSCRTRDVRTVTVNVPQMKNDACAKIIFGALSKTDGIEHTSIDVRKKTVTVTYDSMRLAVKNIEFVIAGAGFDANGIPAPREAREKLPPECK